MADATVVGAGGFIGSALVARLRWEGLTVAAIARGDSVPQQPGHLYFCAGLTGEKARDLPQEAVESHVSFLNEVLKTVDAPSLTYLSSTRVYLRAASGDEQATLFVNPLDPGDIFNLSKLTGEVLCLADPRPTVRIVRLSNVMGADASPSFLRSLVQDARQKGRVVIRAAPLGAKDYVSLEDAVEALVRLPDRARSRLLNVASGRRTTNREIAELIRMHFGVPVEFAPGGTATIYPEIEVERMRNELGLDPEPTPQVFARLFGADSRGSMDPARARLTPVTK